MSQKRTTSEITGWSLQPKQAELFYSKSTETYFGGASEGGKAVDIRELAPTPSGWKAFGDMLVGDELLCPDGTITKILILHPIQHVSAYRVTFDNGQTIDASSDHLWHTYTAAEYQASERCTAQFREKRRDNRPSRAKPTTSERKLEALRKHNSIYRPETKEPSGGSIKTTQEIFETLRVHDCNRANHSIPVTKPLDLPERELPLDPYVLGAWLGDGTSTSSGITGIDEGVWENIEAAGYRVSHHKNGRSHSVLGLIRQLRKTNVLNNKHIPEIYLRASKRQRLALLQGLMDTDGTVGKSGTCEFDNTNKAIIDGVYELIVSLGWKARIREGRAKLYGKDCGPRWRIKWRPSEYVFRLERKRAKQKLSTRRTTKFHYIVDCKPIAPTPMRCITVDNPTGLFLVSKSMIPTHNSFAGRYCLSVWAAAIPNLQCVVFRKYYGDVIANHMEGPASFKRILKQWIDDGFVSTTENTVKFWNGSIISMHGLLHDKDLEKHIGREKNVLWIEEAGQIPRRHIDGLRAWVRMPLSMREELPKLLKPLYPEFTDEELFHLFPRILYTSNPEGPSLSFFRKKFVDLHPTGTIWKAPDKDGGFVRTFIPSHVWDNRYADQEAQAARLLPLGEARARALIMGDHSAPVGSYFMEWDEEKHVVDDFIPPSHWFKFRTFDWGSSDPFAVHWWAMSDGERFQDENGVSRWFPRDALICYREWYGADEDDPSKGINMRNEDIARGIVDRSIESSTGVTLSDNFPFADRGASKNGRRYTMADTFFENGCPLVLGNTARIYGWKQMRSRIQGKDGFPMFYVVKSAQHLINYVPALEYHGTKPEDAVESGEATHACDSARLACSAKPVTYDAPKERDESFEKANTITPKDILKQIKVAKNARSRSARNRRRA